MKNRTIIDGLWYCFCGSDEVFSLLDAARWTRRRHWETFHVLEPSLDMTNGLYWVMLPPLGQGVDAMAGC